MNIAHAVTVQFLLELEPSIAARDAARDLFEKQCGKPPDRFYHDVRLGTWGWIGEDATLLFRTPSKETA